MIAAILPEPAATIGFSTLIPLKLLVKELIEISWLAVSVAPLPVAGALCVLTVVALLWVVVPELPELPQAATPQAARTVAATAAT
jgi:hypothetical protein